MTSAFAMASAVYACSRGLKIKLSRVSHDLFMEYDACVKALKKSVGDLSFFDENTGKLIQCLRTFSYLFSGLPLPFGLPSVFPEEVRNRLARLLKYSSFPSENDRELATDAMKLLEDLVTVSSNPLLQAISDNHGYGDLAVLLAKTRHLSTVQDYISHRYPRARVYTPNSLRKADPFERLFLLGSPSWYPDHVFTAPRYAVLHIVCYEWLYQEKKTGKLLDISPEGSKPIDTDSSTESSWSERWRRRIAEFMAVGNIGKDDEDKFETVSARLFLLEGDYAVFLEDSESAKVYVVDPEGSETEETGTTVERFYVQDLEPEMFVLLRDGGGGDYVVEVADELMGEKAASRRAKQEQWKGRLRKLIFEEGLRETTKKLKKAGSTKAGDLNVRNWASARNIKTRSRDDFHAIMSVIGLADRTDEFWGNAEEILSAHRSAGNEIRRRLLERVAESDLSVLDQQGHMEFELPIAGEEAGKLTARRILSIASKTHELPYYKVGQPFLLEEDEWPE